MSEKKDLAYLSLQNIQQKVGTATSAKQMSDLVMLIGLSQLIKDRLRWPPEASFGIIGNQLCQQKTIRLRNGGFVGGSRQMDFKLQNVSLFQS